HLIMADPRVSTSSVHPLNQLFLQKVLIGAVSFFYLQAQVDRFESGESLHALRTFAPSSNGVDLGRIARICHFRFFMSAIRASQFKTPILDLGGLKIFVN